MVDAEPLSVMGAHRVSKDGAETPAK